MMGRKKFSYPNLQSIKSLFILKIELNKYYKVSFYEILNFQMIFV